MALRLQRAVPFAVISSIGIIGGGIAAAVTGPTDWKRGSWVAAFLVLVVGVGQIGIASGQALLACGPSANGNMAMTMRSGNRDHQLRVESWSRNQMVPVINERSATQAQPYRRRVLNKLLSNRVK